MSSFGLTSKIMIIGVGNKDAHIFLHVFALTKITDMSEYKLRSTFTYTFPYLSVYSGDHILVTSWSHSEVDAFFDLSTYASHWQILNDDKLLVADGNDSFAIADKDDVIIDRFGPGGSR